MAPVLSCLSRMCASVSFGGSRLAMSLIGVANSPGDSGIIFGIWRMGVVAPCSRLPLGSIVSAVLLDAHGHYGCGLSRLTVNYPGALPRILPVLYSSNVNNRVMRSILDEHECSKHGIDTSIANPTTVLASRVSQQHYSSICLEYDVLENHREENQRRGEGSN